MNLASQIIANLQTKTFPNLAFISQPQTLADVTSTLNELLEKSKIEFNKVLELADSETNFENLVAQHLHRDELLEQLFNIVNHLNSVETSATTRKIIEDFQPKFVEYFNWVSLNATYYEKLKKLMSQSKNKLNPLQTRSAELILEQMEFAGVHLKGEAKEKLEQINLELSKLGETFSNNSLDSRKQFFYHFTDSSSLIEMPADDLSVAAQEAKQRNLEGWVFTLSQPSFMAIMKYCSDREVRKIFHTANHQVATTEPFDNRSLVVKILQLRQQKAALLGYANYAEYVLKQRMAQKSQNVDHILEMFAAKAGPKAVGELNDLRKFSGLNDFQNWDLTYWSEKYLKEKFKIDPQEQRQYFELNNTLNGMLKIAQTLFGLEFKKVPAEVYNPDVVVYEVWRGPKLLSYFLLDLFARPSKRSGAWCSDIRGKMALNNSEKAIPVICNSCNFGKSVDGKPSLLHFRDVETLFHEFGHALHNILSEPQYPNLAGFGVEWDFVELPSQLMENWCWNETALALFAQHYESHQPLPSSMLKAMKESKTFNSGLARLRQNTLAEMDMLLHTSKAPQTIQEVENLCKQKFTQHSVVPQTVEYQMYAAFGHLFAGGYGAGYYSYLWAEMLEADVFERFEKEGVLNPKIGKQYADQVLGVGCTQPAQKIFNAFMGHDADPTPLMRKLKFV